MDMNVDLDGLIKAVASGGGECGADWTSDYDVASCRKRDAAAGICGSLLVHFPFPVCPPENGKRHAGGRSLYVKEMTEAASAAESFVSAAWDCISGIRTTNCGRRRWRSGLRGGAICFGRKSLSRGT
uniref:HDC00328 n=1 Tax=Drosophila melanogaster TaxID=7227 RepID=Q6IHY7_DROME|nr:TPA_inf: HDC00328 [Drosophila melanogaster]